MDMMLLILGMVFIVLVIRLIAGTMDHDRVGEYIAERGGRVIDKQWKPFGRGWFGSEHERIYDVKYEDKNGNIHQATCKTSIFSGVYFTEDEIVSYGKNGQAIDRETELEMENRILKQQIEELKRNRL